MTSRAIVRLRESRGLSQADLADRLGMKRAQLCRIERGGVAPTPPTIARIAKALGVNPEDLAEGDCRLEGALMPTRRAVARLKAVRAEAFALRLEELGLIDPELRAAFRDRLRARYKTHRKAMEPAPCLNVLKCGYKLDILSDEGEK